jgi:hypothetical protein
MEWTDSGDTLRAFIASAGNQRLPIERIGVFGEKHQTQVDLDTASTDELHAAPLFTTFTKMNEQRARSL